MVKRERFSIGELIITALWTNAMTGKPKACLDVCICVCVAGAQQAGVEEAKSGNGPLTIWDGLESFPC